MQKVVVFNEDGSQTEVLADAIFVNSCTKVAEDGVGVGTKSVGDDPDGDLVKAAAVSSIVLMAVTHPEIETVGDLMEHAAEVVAAAMKQIENMIEKGDN